jgi:membrane protein implicated in regulation of membrane protease activity
MNMDHMAFVWLVLLVVLLLVEVMTLNLTTIWFAGGSLIALILAFIGVPFNIQAISFVVVSLVVLFLLRPSVVKRYNSSLTQTNVGALVGAEAKVIETINNDEMTGKAIINGQEWTARAIEDDMIIEKDQKAKVVEIKGVKLILSNKKED